VRTYRNTTGEVDTERFSPGQILEHAIQIREKFVENPADASKYLVSLLHYNGYQHSSDPDILAVKEIITNLESSKKETGGDASKTELKNITREIIFRKQIEEYYLPKQLIDTIFAIGEIPKQSTTDIVGIGFIDIADYTFLSKFLSPNENQCVLNGLYTAFQWVLKRHGGYLNKIEGDSIMFHFGGMLDPKIREMNEQQALKHIAKELFYTCVEMQRVCNLFNQANDKFIYESADNETRENLQRAFDIISTLRTSQELSSSMNALYQIRIRIGANIGEVTVGNFGPNGAKQWDIVGLPVIEAKRMEATAPIGGLRISEALYDILREIGVVDDYYNRFKREALALGGYYKGITKDELFKLKKVILKDKKNAEFISYSVQVNPALPENISSQVELLLDKGESGSEKIIELLQYYRGNKFVINAVEDVFRRKGVRIRKDKIMKIIYPKKYEAFYKKLGQDVNRVSEYFERRFSLFDLLKKLGEYQDKIKTQFTLDMLQYETNKEYINFDYYLSKELEEIKHQYNLKKKSAFQKLYFFNIVYPLVFVSIKSSILEYQHQSEMLEEL